MATKSVEIRMTIVLDEEKVSHLTLEEIARITNGIASWESRKIAARIGGKCVAVKSGALTANAPEVWNKEITHYL